MRPYEKYEKKKPETFSKWKFSWKRIIFFKGFLDLLFFWKLLATIYHHVEGTELILYHVIPMYFVKHAIWQKIA